MPSSLLRMPRAHTTLTYRSPEGIAFANLTEPVSRAVSASGIKEGFAVIKNHGGSPLLVQEAEQQVEQDLLARLKRYDRGEWQSLFQPYQALPIIGGKLKLGRYQSILMILMCDEQAPNVSVTLVPGRLEAIAIDTGKDECLVYERNKSTYWKRGGERIFDITEKIGRFVRIVNSSDLEDALAYAGTGNTTCVLYHDTKGEGVEGLVKRMDAFAPPNLPISAYGHNDLAKRINIPPDERQNGRAHVIGATLSTSLLFPVSGPKGRVYLVELDGPRKLRSLNMGFSPLQSLSKAYK